MLPDKALHWFTLRWGKKRGRVWNVIPHLNAKKPQQHQRKQQEMPRNDFETSPSLLCFTAEISVPYATQCSSPSFPKCEWYKVGNIPNC